MNYNNAVFETSAGTSKSLIPSDLPEVCFSGHSNVGKSSLINKLLGRKSIARVSNKPGKTVTVNFFKCDGVRLADLPGYGFAKVSFQEKQRWSELMQYYFASDRNIKIVFQLIDSRHKPTADDMDMVSYLQETGFRFVIVLTKIDKLKSKERAANLEMFKDLFGNITMIPFSAETGEGNDVLRGLLESVAEQP